ncbi:hypothetical protein GGR56DRAFT_602854 [Xylariaceae sp. FL0804]|nr:hypothetical protein GGR56DRAFT_602854 [Xylariaceae sp. FL0804]
MAFQQPARQPAARVFRPAPEDGETRPSPRPVVTQSVDESQTWVLFAPATDAGTSASYLTSTHKTNSTPGRSRLSDLGSLDTLARSEASAHQQRSVSYIDGVDEDEDADEDDAELDSLDSHLPEFRSTPDFYGTSQALPHATPVVPAHDGLGSFRLEQEGMGTDVQNRLYAFEQYNPRRIKRRRESLDLARVELESEQAQEMDKMRRIESWRLEQSRCLLEEVQKETRRQRRSAAPATSSRRAEKKAEDDATMSNVGETRGSLADRDEDWHDQQAGEPGDGHESMWSRITRKVIRDLMGIDDKMLAVLFGEALPDEEDLSSTPKASASMSPRPSSDVAVGETSDSGWQLRMLERVAKELGSLVHQLSEHPGAFSTFGRMQQMPIPYAGLPSIPETAHDPPPPSAPATEAPPTTMPEFRPTIATPARPIDVPRVRSSPDPVHSSPLQSESHGATFTQDEWEQDLDVRLIFRYLRSRFLSRPSSSGGLGGSSSSSHHLGSSSGAQDAAAKAARVRQHHPLVSRAAVETRRKSRGSAAAAAGPSSPGLLFRHASTSCASQSTRRTRSVRRSSCSSSRHYWDIGGSVGTGSMIATTGPMGSWGEV